MTGFEKAIPAFVFLSTFIAGVLSGMMRRQLFENKRPSLFSGFGLGATMEVLHMLLVLLTNLSNVSRAFLYVQQCAFTMILCNGIAVCLASLACGVSAQREQLDNKTGISATILRSGCSSVL